MKDKDPTPNDKKFVYLVILRARDAYLQARKNGEQINWGELFGQSIIQELEETAQ